VRLWITADDYGLAPGVNQAIEALATSRAITAASVMVHDAARLESLDRLREAGIALGPHLVFVEEAPLLPVSVIGPLLERDGRFPRSYASLFARLLTRPRLATLLRKEAEAQIDRYLSLGLPVNLINSHQHVHLFPPAWRALAPVFRQYPGAAVRASTRMSARFDKQGLLDLSSRLAASMTPLPDHDLLHPLGVSYSGHLTAEVASAIIARRALESGADAQSNTTLELVVHPALDDSELVQRYGHWRFDWRQEYDMLASGALRESLARRSIFAERWH
jgi:predicted glycoside hydrolase/deacetylase ChbG (UPF0249 family)